MFSRFMKTRKRGGPRQVSGDAGRIDQAQVGACRASIHKDAPELKGIAALQPFKHSLTPTRDVNIALLANGLDQQTKAKVMTLRTGTDGFHMHRREIYWWRRKKPGTSLYSTVPLAKVLTQPFTIRSKNRMRRLAAKFP